MAKKEQAKAEQRVRQTAAAERCDACGKDAAFVYSRRRNESYPAFVRDRESVTRYYKCENCGHRFKHTRHKSE